MSYPFYLYQIPASPINIRPAAAAPIQPLAWEPPYAAGMALKRQKKKKKKRKEKIKSLPTIFPLNCLLR